MFSLSVFLSYFSSRPKLVLARNRHQLRGSKLRLCPSSRRSKKSGSTFLSSFMTILLSPATYSQNTNTVQNTLLDVMWYLFSLFWSHYGNICCDKVMRSASGIQEWLYSVLARDVYVRSVYLHQAFNGSLLYMVLFEWREKGLNHSENFAALKKSCNKYQLWNYRIKVWLVSLWWAYSQRIEKTIALC